MLRLFDGDGEKMSIRLSIVNSLFPVTHPHGKFDPHEFLLSNINQVICIPLHKKVLKSHIAKHMCGYYTEEMVDFKVYYNQG